MQQHSLKPSVVFSILVASGILLLCSATSFAGTPQLGPDCGTAAAIVGSDTAGKIILGTPDPEGPATGTCTLNFAVPYTNPPACTATNETNGGGFPAPMGTRTTHTTLVIGSSAGSSPGDTISYVCADY
jgi:hypothetical protein